MLYQDAARDCYEHVMWEEQADELFLAFAPQQPVDPAKIVQSIQEILICLDGQCLQENGTIFDEEHAMLCNRYQSTNIYDFAL